MSAAKGQPEEQGIGDKIEASFSKGVSKTKTFLQRLITILLIAAVLFGIFYFLYANWSYSNGTRAGYLIKISKKGYVFKTYEGQLNLGGFQADESTGVIGNIWNFSLTDDELYQKMQTMEGKRVTLTYKEINKAMPWQGDSNYFITEIEETE